MSNQIFLWHHLEMGDNLICNAIVRNYAKRFSFVNLYCKKVYFSSIMFMYRDLTNIRFIVGNNEDEIRLNYNNLRFQQDAVKKHITCGNERFDERNFDELFYINAGIPYENRWNEFFVKRDLNREIQLFNNLGLKDKQYIFVHDDFGRGFNIKNQYLVNGLIFKPDKKFTDNIFDYLTIMERAKEIHCIDSSFAILTDQMNIQTKLFFHYYARKDSLWLYPKHKCNWKVFNE